MVAGNIRPYFNPYFNLGGAVISCSSFLSKRDAMTPNETILPASLIKPLRVLMPLYCLFIIWASLRTSSGEQSIQHLDKLMHAGVYGGLAFGVSLTWPNLSKIKIGIFCLLFGGLMEVAQGMLTASRVPSFWDFTANGFGAAAALITVIFINHIFAR